ncbi:MAG: alpha/beta hydrolase, partial [Nocardia sp.]|nr:alpha/beta hydrolase [Nocardia sp.]
DPDLTARARAPGRLWDIDTGHDLMITEPEATAAALGRVAAA